MARKPRVEPELSVHSDSEGSEEETTRCICGNEELKQNARTRGANPGLFVQCENCHVWQHGFCVGFTREKNVPDTYFCEKCRPDFHEIVETDDGFTKSRYQPHIETQDEETQFDGSKSTENIEAEQEAEEIKEPESGEHEEEEEEEEEEDKQLEGVEEDRGRDSEATQGKVKYHKRRSVPTPLEDLPERTSRAGRKRRSREEEILQRVLEESAREARELEAANIPEEDGINDYEDPEGKANNDNDKMNDKTDESWRGSSAKVRGSKNNQNHRKDTEYDDESIDKLASLPEKPRRGRRGRKRANADQNAKTHNGHTATQNGGGAVKKSKPKFPSTRSSLPEMRRRVASIIEFSTRVQADISTGINSREAAVANINSDSPELVGKVETLASQSEANLATLEALTRKLLSWQEEFGM